MKLLDCLSHHMETRAVCKSLAIQLDLELSVRADMVNHLAARYDDHYPGVAIELFKKWLGLDCVRQMSDSQKKLALQEVFLLGMQSPDLAKKLDIFYGVRVELYY